MSTIRSVAKLLRISLGKILSYRNGQISDKNDIGRWITLLSSLEENKIIVEIGTWNGRGSSQMIVRGVLKKLANYPNTKTDIAVHGFEINPKMHKRASRILKKYDFFSVVYGSVVTTKDLDSANLKDMEREWIEQDIAWMESAPLVIDRVPDSIDLLILDGGEFSTKAEFDLLESRIRNWLILDDTNIRKCQSIVEKLSTSSNYVLVFQSDERNGTAVYRKLA